ncbi:MAG: outer membrane beta-barrel protein [Bacteroidota bacterium]
MTKTKATFLFLLVLLTSGSIVLAGSSTLKGRSTIELSIGLWHESKVSNEISTAGIISTAKTSGFLGGLSYAYWVQEDLSVGISGGALAGEATSSVSTRGISQRASAVVPVLLGLRYYVGESSAESPVRPFLSVGLGPFIGVEAKNEPFLQESHSEAALGTRLGGGIDFLLGQSFKLGASVGYDLMTDFSTPIGARKNYNGPDFSLGVGLVFGGD